MPDSQSSTSGTVYDPFLYDATDHQLEKWLLLGVCVAGKTARQQQDKLDAFLGNLQLGCVEGSTPFEMIRSCMSSRGGKFEVEMQLRTVRMGQYIRITEAFCQMATRGLDLRTCTRDELTQIPGIGMKTASFFILFSRRDARVACLDVHILAYLRETGLDPKAPTATPSERQYLALEKVFIEHAEALGRPIAELDFEIWLARNRGDKVAPRSSSSAGNA